jgi:uncharacterized protein YndB with AHSA1/START domain
MPKQKDLKRLVRSRMEKTGEAYTAARLQVINKRNPLAPDYAPVAGMSDASVKKQTSRTWAEWVSILDAANAAQKPHREIAEYVSSLGTPDWWSQMVTVGYERIKGLRDRGQRRGGAFEASKSRTFNVAAEKLFDAFENARIRRRWLPVKITIRSATKPKRMRITWDDDTSVEIGFVAKSSAKTAVAIQHGKLPDKAAIATMKQRWAEYLEKLSELLR